MTEAINQDQEHLRLLAIFHYVVAGLTTLFACLPLIHLVVGILAIVTPESMTDKSGNVPPPFFGWMFAIIGGMMIFLGWAFAISLFCAGRFLARRKHYLFCFVIACLNCLFVPLGTALGVFAIIVLLRPSVKELFAGQAG